VVLLPAHLSQSFFSPEHQTYQRPCDMDAVRQYFEGTVVASAWVLWLLLKCNLLTTMTRRLNLLEASQRNREGTHVLALSMSFERERARR
jgi:hypothetical protein